MKNCWANGLGNCSDQISLEHYISQGIFDDKSIIVQGFSWCLDKPARIGIASFGANILCTKHNNELGECIDLEGVKLIKFLQNPSNKENSLIIKNDLFERWLLKTAINLSIKENCFIGVGMNNSEKNKVPDYLLHIAFNKNIFSYEMGLYILPAVVQSSVQNSVIAIVPFLKNDEIGGFYFNLYGLGFFLSLFPCHTPPSLYEIGIENDLLPSEHLNVTPIYRPNEIQIEHNFVIKKIMFR